MGRNIIVLYVVGFLDLFAVSMTIPLLVSHCKSLGATPFLAGLIGSVYGFIQFLFGPFMGKCSDTYGRKFILQICFLMSALSYLLMSASITLVIVFLSRIPAGIFKHTQELSKSYLAASVKACERNAIFGKFNAISNVGFVLGPVIGGHLVDTSAGFYLVAATTSFIFFINLALITMFLEEKDCAYEKKVIHSLFTLPKGIKWKFLSRFSVILLLRFLMAFAAFVCRYDLVSTHGAKNSGWISSLSGVVSSLSGFLITPLVCFYSRNDRRLLLHLSIVQCTSIVLLTLFPDFMLQLLFTIPFSIANSVLRVVSTNMTLNLARKEDVGLVMGIGSSTVAIGRFLSPLAGGISQEMGGVGPGVLGSISSFTCATIVFTVVCRQKKNV